MSHRVRVARSGVMYYHEEELPGLGLHGIPRHLSGQRVFGAYRPAHVLDRAAPLFANVPVVRGHEGGFVTGATDSRVIGRSTDSVTVSMCGDELSLNTSLVFDHDGVYMSEVSPGYTATYHWCSGRAATGEAFDIVCDSIDSVNHIALVDRARGGKDMKVLDAKSGLLRYARRLSGGVMDGESDRFVELVDMLHRDLFVLSETDLESTVNELLSLVADLPTTQDKDKLCRFIADVPLLPEADRNTATAALTTICEAYRKLEREAIKDVMEVPMADPVEEQKPISESQEEAKPTPENPENGDTGSSPEQTERPSEEDKSPVQDGEGDGGEKSEDSSEPPADKGEGDGGEKSEGSSEPPADKGDGGNAEGEGSSEPPAGEPPAQEAPAAPAAPAASADSMAALSAKIDGLINIVTSLVSAIAPQSSKEGVVMGNVAVKDSMPETTAQVDVFKGKSSLDELFEKIKSRG